MEHKELINWIRLINSNGIGPISFYKLTEKYGSVQDALEHIDKDKVFSVREAEEEIELNSPIDIVEFSLKDAWNSLGEIIGETYTDELIDELFSRFCLGK